MNELQISRGTAPAPKSGLPAQERYLAPERALAWHLPKIRTMHFPVMRAASNDEDPARQMVQHEANLQQIRTALESSPSQRDIAEVEQVLQSALRAAPDVKVTMTAVALLMDSQTRGPHNPTAFLNIAGHDVMDEGYGPEIVTAACRRLRRSQTFTASVAEILAACRAVRDEYAAALRRCAEAAKAHRMIGQCVESTTRALADLRAKAAEATNAD